MCRTSASDIFFSVRAPSPLLLDGNRCRSRARVRIRNETGLCGGGGLGLHFYVLKVLSVARNVFVIVFFSPSQTLSGGKSIPILKTANVSQIWYFKEEKRGRVKIITLSKIPTRSREKLVMDGTFWHAVDGRKIGKLVGVRRLSMPLAVAVFFSSILCRE